MNNNSRFPRRERAFRDDSRRSSARYYEADADRDTMPRLVVSNERVRDPRISPRWFFDNMVVREENNPRDGAAVLLVDTRGRQVGSAIYNSHSKIRARLFSYECKQWTADYVREAVSNAVQRRLQYFRSDDSMRLIYADADFLPGVVADCLGNVIVIQLLTMAADMMVDVIVDELQTMLKPAGFVLQLGSPLREKEGLAVLPNRQIGEVAPKVWVQQDGFGLYADVIGGQKTGLFLDQRFNRRLLSQWASGRTVLDLFCHVGGWSMSALTQGAAHTVGVDSSADALEMARASAERNNYTPEQAEFIHSDAFDFLDKASDEKQYWDIIVTDPPAFAKNSHVLDSALRGYLSLNYRAMKQLSPGGLLVACSCSQAVREDVFEDCLMTGARNAKMQFQIVARGGQSPDHPILLGFDESRYLKCLVLRRLE